MGEGGTAALARAGGDHEVDVGGRRERPKSGGGADATYIRRGGVSVKRSAKGGVGA